MLNVLDEFESRGFLEQMTHEKETRELLSKDKISFYIGFDPTANSLHVGNFVGLMAASHMQKCGHRPIILVGGGTATISDPTGKTDMRRMMSFEEINNNIVGIKKQLSKFLNFDGENGAIIVNNGEWLLKLNFVDFVREIGSLFSVNKMLTAECYKQRLDTGLTFYEFSYMLMQSYDFLYLHDKYDCKMQIGGNDQWSNILGGVDLVRKVGKDDSYGLTFKLLTTKNGKKMGKTESGTLWLDPEKTPPYEFYQYWRNMDDSEVKDVLSLLTFIPMEEVNRLSNLKDQQINEAKKVAAFEITKMIHGEKSAQEAQNAALALFEGAGDAKDMPTTKTELNTGITDILVLTKLAPSKGQAKILIAQGGITLNDKKIEDINYIISEADFKDGYAIIKKGKKVYHKLEI